MRMMRFILRSLAGSLLFLLATSSPIRAQSIPPRSGEVSGNVGFSSLKGVDGSRHIFFGGSSAYNLSQSAAIGFDYSYQSMGSLRVGGANGTEHLQLFGPVFRLGLNRFPRAVPYLLVGGGGAVMKTIASSGNVGAGASRIGAYFGVGGGISIYANRHWGIRPEFRYERHEFPSTTISGTSLFSFGENDAQGSLSLFYQFGGTR